MRRQGHMTSPAHVTVTARTLSRPAPMCATSTNNSNTTTTPLEKRECVEQRHFATRRTRRDSALRGIRPGDPCQGGAAHSRFHGDVGSEYPPSVLFGGVPG